MRQIILHLIGILLLTACLQDVPDDPPLTESPTDPPTELPTEPPFIPSEEAAPTLPPPTAPATAQAAVTPLRLGKGAVWASSLSPNGQWLFVVSEADMTLYQFPSLQVTWSGAGAPIGERWPKFEIGWASGGSELLLLNDKLVTITDTQTGAQLRQFELPERPTAAAFSPNGALLAVFIGDAVGPTTIWDVETGQQVWVIEETYSGPNALAWSPDGSTLVAGTKLFDVASQTVLRDLVDGVHANEPSSYCCISDDVVFSPDGRLIAILGSRMYGPDGVVNVYDAASGALVSGWYTKHSPDSITFTPDSREVAYTDRLGTLIRFVDPYTGQETRTITGAGGLESYANGILIATPLDAILIFDAGTGQLLAEFGGYTFHGGEAVYSPDGSLLATSSDTRIHLWDAHTGAWKRAFAPGHPDAELSWSPDGRLLAVGMAYPMVWDVQTGQLIQHLNDGVRRQIYHSQVAFSPQGDRLAATSGNFDEYWYGSQWVGEDINESYWIGGDGDQLRLWDTNTGAILHSLPINGPIRTFAWSPDGSTLVVAWVELYEGEESVDDFQGIAFWNTVTGELSSKTEWWVGIESNYLLLWSPSEAILASTVGPSLWGIDAGKEIHTLDLECCYEYIGVDVLAFNQDGTSVMGFQFNTIFEWSTATGELLSQRPIVIYGNDDDFRGLAFSPDLSHLVVGYDGDLLIVPMPPP